MTTPPVTNPRSEVKSPGNVSPLPPVKGGRGRKPGTVAKERADIPAEEMQLVQLPEKAKADLRRKREPRTVQQKAVDQVIWDIFQENVDSGFDNGTIADWADLFVYDWAVSKTHHETAMFMINKAVTLYHRKAIYGEQIEVPGDKTHLIPNTSEDDENAPEEVPCHLNGKPHIHVPFSVVRRPRRSRSV